MEPAFQGTHEHLGTSWSDGTYTVLIDRLVYSEQSRGVELIGYMSRIAPDSVLLAQHLFGPVGSERRIVSVAIIRDGDEHVLVWYWYRVGRIETAQPLNAKLLEMVACVRRSTAAELIAVSTACEPEGCVEASHILSAFLGECVAEGCATCLPAFA